jgi:hypothetical protein
MTRKDQLSLLIQNAEANGFDFRRWFQLYIHSAWPGSEQALGLLSEESRYYALLFSHPFASSFWRTGAQMSFSVPGTTYPRVNSRGEVVHVTRKAFTRRTIKPDVWKYHLRQMAVADDPIAYLCRFLPAPEQLKLDHLKLDQLKLDPLNLDPLNLDPLTLDQLQPDHADKDPSPEPVGAGVS